METIWEYCALVSHQAEDPQGVLSWGCRLSYFTSDGVQTFELCRPGQPYPMDVFERAMAQLGAGGWELVSLNHELVRNNANVSGEQFLATIHTGYSFSPFGVAYFKRTVQAGRPIDEPRVTFPESGVN